MSDDWWNVEQYDGEARRLYDEGDYEGALALIREGLERHPEAVELHISLGYTHLALEDYGWARSSFLEALAIESDHEEALVGLGDALLKLGDRSQAFLCFDRVVDLGFADDEDLMLAVGRALYREGLYERACRFYRYSGGHPEAQAELGYSLYQLGEHSDAARFVAAALGMAPHHHEARVFYGNLLYDEGDYEGALSHFRRVPPDEMWDPLAVWRTVELLRSYEGVSSDAEVLRPFLEQLDYLSTDPSPEDRLLSQIEASQSSTPGEEMEDRQQLDLFALGPTVPEGRDPDVHTVRARDGQVYTGDWLSIVGAMRDRSTDPSLTIAEFMRETARMLEDLTGVSVPHDDPEAFLRGSARVGILSIER